MRKAGIAVVVALGAQGAVAQGLTSHEVGNCSTINDPTRQRLCIESAQQARPASAFDPAAEQPKRQEKAERRTARRDAIGLPVGTAHPPEKRPEPTAEAELKRKDWRLQIP